jgi:hypothetical protein
MDLRERGATLEMMKRVPDDHCIDRAVREGDLLSGSVDDADRGQSLFQHRSHVRRGLHGDQIHAQVGEPSRQLAGSGGEIDHDRAPAEGALPRDPRGSLRRVARTELVVVDGVDDLEAEPASHRREPRTGPPP